MIPEEGIICTAKPNGIGSLEVRTSIRNWVKKLRQGLACISAVIFVQWEYPGEQSG